MVSGHSDIYRNAANEHSWLAGATELYNRKKKKVSDQDFHTRVYLQSLMRVPPGLKKKATVNCKESNITRDRPLQ